MFIPHRRSTKPKTGCCAQWIPRSKYRWLSCSRPWMINPTDAILLVSFGGPDRPEEVMPFLENVLRGRNVPHERMLEVAEHYYRFGGRSPINDQNRALLAALRKVLAAGDPDLAVYWGNRNWHPLLADTLRQMKADGVRRAFAFVTSAYSSYSGCRQYLEDIARARAAAGYGALEVLKLRAFYNHPAFIETMADRLRTALERIPPERRATAAWAFTAHSVPVAMAETSRYVQQVEEACRLVAERLDNPPYRLVYQSRSGAPGQPWLGPDVLEYLRELAAAGAWRDVVLAPIGFIPANMEWCTIWIPKRASCVNNLAWTWSAPKPLARIRVSPP